MDSNIRMINISVELCGILMCLMGIAVVLIGRRMERKTSRYFAAIFGCPKDSLDNWRKTLSLCNIDYQDIASKMLN